MKTLQTVRKGFTLIEILVTVIVIGVLAAIVIPAVTQQSTAGDATRIVEDLNNIRGGMETFNVNVRPKLPGDIEDLIHSISSTSGDQSLDGVAYSAADAGRWNGPYIEGTSANLSAATGTDIFKLSGYSGNILQDLTVCANDTYNYGCAPSSTGANLFSTIVISPLTSEQFELVNVILDGVETAGTGQSWANGRMRFQGTAVSGVAYYLASPYRNP